MTALLSEDQARGLIAAGSARPPHLSDADLEWLAQAPWQAQENRRRWYAGRLGGLDLYVDQQPIVLPGPVVFVMRFQGNTHLGGVWVEPKSKPSSEGAE